MVTLIALLKRKPGMSAEDFHDHWRNTHGPLVTEHLGKYIVHYEQHHALDDGEYDGVAVLTFARREDFDAFLADPKWIEVVHQDEKKFLDLGSTIPLLTAEPEVVIE